MTARTAAAMATQIATLAADNTAGDISESDIRSLLTDLKDTLYAPVDPVVMAAALTATTGTFTGDVTVNAGDVILDSGKGVDYTANSGVVLDQYDEGNHVATITCATSGSFGLSGSSDTLAWTETGRGVDLQGRLQVTSESSPSGALRISIPHTLATLLDTGDTALVPIRMFNHGGTITNPCVKIQPGVAYLEIWQVTDAGIASVVDETDVDTNFFIELNVSYITA